MKEPRFIVDSLSISHEIDTAVVQGFEGSAVFASEPRISMDMHLIITDPSAIADLGRIPELTEMLHKEMERVGLCAYCGCRVTDDSRVNCSQCGGAIGAEA